MTPIARRTVMLGGAVTAVAAITGCTERSTDDKGGPSSTKVPDTLPSTFQDRAVWKQAITPHTVPVECPEGIAIVTAGRRDPKEQRLALISPATGAVRWGSRDFAAPADAAPILYSITSPTASWVVTVVETSTTELALAAYQAAGAGDRREPIASTVLKGIGADRPVLHVTTAGIVAYALAEGDPETAYLVNPETMAVTRWDGPGALASSWGDMQIVTGAGEGGDVACIVGGAPVWVSADKRPDGASDGPAELVAVGDSLVATRWETTDGAPLLAVHALRTGEVLGTLTMSPGASDDARAQEQHRLVQTGDGDWALLGDLAVSLRGEGSRRVDLHGGRATMVYRDVLYVLDAGSPLLASKASPSASDGGGAAPGGGSYAGIIDMATGLPLTNVSATNVPLFMSNASQGVVVVDNAKESVAYSVPLA